MRYFDTHCHLTSDHFREDMDAVADSSAAAGVGMLAVAGSPADSARCVDLASRHPGVWAAVGVHPCNINEVDDASWAELERLAGHPRVKAIGETGLDYYWKDTDPEMQKVWFRKHCQLALATGKPVSIHARDSVPDVLAEIAPYMREGMKAIWHCFAAGKKVIGPAFDFAVEHGLYLAVGGMVTFEDQKPLRSHAARIPDRLLLLETDAPYLVPRPKAGRRNTPAGVIRVAEELALLRGSSPEAVAEITTTNAVALLGIDG